MKTKIILLCVVFLVTQATTYGQKTEVRVQKGKVIAQTASGTVTVDAGRKAVLTQDKEPFVTVDNPLVDDIMKIYKWVEAEKHAQKEKIDTSYILIIKIENEHLLTVAYFTEQLNPKSEPSDTFLMPEGGILDDPKYYDMQGNLLEFDIKKINAKRGRYNLHFPELVEPGDKFRFIFTNKAKPHDWIRKEGPLRQITQFWTVPNQLNYYRFILPESAVFVDSSRPVTIIDSHDGRTAVTVRNYTGPIGDGAIQVAFLWPDQDGTTLMDLPPQYRGLRDQRQEETIREGRLAFAKILAGDVYDDQSTPLDTLRTLCSAIIREDKELFVSLMDTHIRKIAAQQYNQFVGAYGSLLLDFEFLGTPDWPEKPENGFTHPVYLCRKSSLLCAATITMVYKDGKWYLQDMKLDG